MASPTLKPPNIAFNSTATRMFSEFSSDCFFMSILTIGRDLGLSVGGTEVLDQRNNHHNRISQLYRRGLKRRVPTRNETRLSCCEGVVVVIAQLSLGRQRTSHVHRNIHKYAGCKSRYDTTWHLRILPVTVPHLKLGSRAMIRDDPSGARSAWGSKELRRWTTLTYADVITSSRRDNLNCQFRLYNVIQVRNQC